MARTDQTDRETDERMDRQTYRQAGREAGRQAGRQASWAHFHAETTSLMPQRKRMHVRQMPLWHLLLLFAPSHDVQ